MILSSELDGTWRRQCPVPWLWRALLCSPCRVFCNIVNTNGHKFLSSAVNATQFSYYYSNVARYATASVHTTQPDVGLSRRPSTSRRAASARAASKIVAACSLICFDPLKSLTSACNKSSNRSQTMMNQYIGLFAGESRNRRQSFHRLRHLLLETHWSQPLPVQYQSASRSTWTSTAHFARVCRWPATTGLQLTIIFTRLRPHRFRKL